MRKPSSRKLLFMKGLCIALSCILFGITTQAQINYKPQTIKVKGSAEKQVEPNEIHLVVDIQEVKERNTRISIQQARTEFFKICDATKVSKDAIDMSYMRSQLMKQKISFWRRKKTELIQREVYDIKFKDMDKMLRFIDQIDKPFVRSIRFGKQTHTEMMAYRKQVKEEATKGALKKARYLSQAAGQEIGKVIFIEEISNNYNSLANQRSNTISYAKKSYGGNAKVNFGFQPIELRYEVLVVCELK